MITKKWKAVSTTIQTDVGFKDLQRRRPKAELKSNSYRE